MNIVRSNCYKEFVKNLPDDKVKTLYTRFLQKYPQDNDEVLNILSSYEQSHAMLASANNYQEFFQTLDQIEYAVVDEHKKRTSK